MSVVRRSPWSAAVAEDQRRLPVGDPLHPPDQHLGVEPVDVHARAVDVEVAQHHVVEPVHGPEAAQHALVERPWPPRRTCRCCRGGGARSVGNSSARPYTDADEAATTLRHLAVGGRLQDVERAVDQHLEGQPGLLGALGDPDGGLVEDQVLAARSGRGPGRRRGCRPPRGAPDRPEARRRGSPSRPGPGCRAPDLGRARLQELVDDRRADRAGAAGDQDVRPCRARSCRPHQRSCSMPVGTIRPRSPDSPTPPPGPRAPAARPPVGEGPRPSRCARRTPSPSGRAPRAPAGPEPTMSPTGRRPWLRGVGRLRALVARSTPRSYTAEPLLRVQVVPHQRALVPPTTICRILVGLSQFTCTCAMAPPGSGSVR